MIEGESEALQPVPNGGPSWKWLAGIALSIIGVGITALVIVMWNNGDNLNTKMDNQAISLAADLAEIKTDLASVKAAQQQEIAERAKIWDRLSTDHEMLVKHEWELGVNNDWISAHAHADRAVRELHGR